MFKAKDPDEVVIVEADPATSKVSDMVFTKHIVRVTRKGEKLRLHLSDGTSVEVDEAKVTSGPYAAVIQMGK